MLSEIKRFKSHQDKVWSVAFNPATNLLASSSGDHQVHLYAYLNESWTQVASLPQEHKRTVRALAWSPNGSYLATASFDASVGIWEKEDHVHDNWSCTSVLEGHESECKSVAFNNSSTLLASSSRDKSVWIWEVTSGNEPECVSVLMEHTQDVKHVTFHPHSDELLASASYDDTINIYKDDPSDDWYVSSRFKKHSSTVWACEWSPSGHHLVSVSDDLSIIAWNDAGVPTAILNNAHKRSIYTIVWLDENYIATGGADGALSLWKLGYSDGVITKLVLVESIDKAHGGADINSLAYTPKTKTLASAGDDGSVNLYDYKSE
ncbi:hypothetical protein E3P86_00371 [Wallemia ichthyophaga]|uniref:Probable cytosolic iron-sulfur protein assembly protein 1 n=1 Tax=Wallemia ichthyophaga TaxID=245174 RepID=A0A4T0JH70_WALIC|nr:hypothetical protein E3P86_00371 [Wallemia ichthyophaga]